MSTVCFVVRLMWDASWLRDPLWCAKECLSSTSQRVYTQHPRFPLSLSFFSPRCFAPLPVSFLPPGVFSLPPRVFRHPWIFPLPHLSSPPGIFSLSRVFSPSFFSSRFFPPLPLPFCVCFLPVGVFPPLVCVFPAGVCVFPPVSVCFPRCVCVCVFSPG